MEAMRIAIIGAGPIGIEAAAFFRAKGQDVGIYERGSSIASNVASWGHVGLFSPFSMNCSPWGIETVSSAGFDVPNADALLSGQEYVSSYLKPLVEAARLSDRISCDSQVQSISREAFGKGNLIGKRSRTESKFRLLIQSNSDGSERIENADVVLDCSGTYGNHNWIGTGGMPCPGEKRCLSDEWYELPSIDSGRFSGKHTLVIGAGYSAATSVVALGELCQQSPETRVTWITRYTELPISRIENDSLSERDRLAAQANQSATENQQFRWLPGWLVQAIEKIEDKFRVQLTDGADIDDLLIDRIVANVGYRPDRDIYRELQVHECYASEGPIKLAAALLGDKSGDCLNQSSHGADTLKNPEPRFFVLGAKSYGRNSKFLLKLGIDQIVDVGKLVLGDGVETKS